MRGVPAKEPSFIQRNVQKNVVFFIYFFYRFDRSGRHFEFFVVVVITHN